MEEKQKDVSLFLQSLILLHNPPSVKTPKYPRCQPTHLLKWSGQFLQELYNPHSASRHKPETISAYVP